MTLRQLNHAFFGLLAKMKDDVVKRTGGHTHWKSLVALPVFTKYASTSVFRASADVRKRIGAPAAPQAAAPAPSKTGAGALGLLAKGCPHRLIMRLCSGRPWQCCQCCQLDGPLRQLPNGGRGRHVQEKI